ncbi:long-chain-alcohol oxidase FAO4A-like protein, partial [Trifolium pratense]
MQKSKRKKGDMVFKIDLEKTYDNHIIKNIDDVLWKPVRLYMNGPPLSHLFFADDVNTTKSKVFFSSNTQRGKISSIVASTGRNLHLHPVIMAWGYFPDAPELWPEEHKKSYEGGIMMAMSTVATDFNKSGYGVVIQTPSLHPGLFSVLMLCSSGTDIKERMRKFSRTTHVFALARDQGSGTMVDSPNCISYQLKDVDRDNLSKGIEKVLRILAAAGAEEIGTHNNNGRSLKV